MIHAIATDKGEWITTIELSPNSPAAQIQLEHDGEVADIGKSIPHMVVDGKEVPVVVIGSLLMIEPKNISLKDGVYNFSLTLDKTVILKGYFKWRSA